MIETTRIGAGGWSCALAALLWTVALPAGAQPPTRPPSAPVDRGEQQPPSQGDEEPPSAEDPPAEEPPAEEPPAAEEPPPAAEAPGEVSPAGDPSVEGDPAAEGTSGIEGRLVDSATQEGLEGAPVIARGRGEGQTYSTLTEQYGQFRLALPPGRYTVRALYDMYHPVRIEGVRILENQFSSLTLHLDPMETEDVVVDEIEIVYRADTSSDSAQIQLRRESGGIGEGVGAQQMSQQGSSDAGAAAARVVGVTIQSSQLVVRGLGGRYNRVLLNGVEVPSTDPDYPAVDLDLFPSSVIESMTLAKAFLPDLPADWAGGLLLINTLGYPRDFTLEVGASFGIGTRSTFRDRLTYDGGNLDWLGFDDGTRSVPSSIPRERVSATRTGPFTTIDQLEPLGEAFEDTWQYERTTSLPNMGLDLTIGDSFAVGEGNRFGYLATFGYGYKSLRETGHLSHYNQPVDLDLERGIDQVDLGALVTTSLDLGQDHSITALGLFNRSLENTTELHQGRMIEYDRAERWQLQFLSRGLVFGQLLGDHRNLAGTRLRLRWSGFASHGRREEPDRRTVLYGSREELFRWEDKASSGERFYSNLEQRELGGTLSLRFPLWPEGWGTIGGRVRTSTRDFENRRFRMLQMPGRREQTLYGAPIEELFGPEGIGTLTRIDEETDAVDSYSSQQDGYAAFAMLETPIVGPLSLTGGARVEIFSQQVQSRSPFPSENTEELEEENRTNRTDVDVLPGVALKLELTEDMFLRAAYGMTIGRPQIRELAPYRYYDFVRNRNVTGDPDLSRTVIHNADLRWEWFFGESDILAVSGFFKQLIDPIELTIQDPVTQDAIYLNAESGRSAGAEFELRMGLGHLHPALDVLSFGANLAIIWSDVDLPPERSGAVRSNRRLFDQAPYVLNLSLGFDEPDTGLSLNVVYNLVGPRITEAGTRASVEGILPDVYRQPFHSLNLIGSWQANEHLKLKLKIENLLFDTHDYRQGGVLIERVNPGARFTLGLAYTY